MAHAGGIDPWADAVVSYDAGSTATPGYDDPTVALGRPTRFGGQGVFPRNISPFFPPFLPDKIVSVGENGHLTVEFFEPIVDDPANPFGIDLIVFGNGGFIDEDGNSGNGDALIGDPPSLFGLDSIEVSGSADGLTFVPLGTFTEGFFPTMGYLDTDLNDDTPGSVPTEFRRPVDPGLTVSDFAGLNLAGVRDLYDESGGGTGIDIAGSGLAWVRFVRIDVLDDGNPNEEVNAEIDAFVTVPEPSTMVLAGILVLCGVVGKKRQ